MFNKNCVSSINNEIPWTEKYRPKTLDDLVGQHNIKTSLQTLFETKNMPHLLFYGKPGTGKTSTILSIANQIYGKDLMKDRIIELNASQERGIKVVREKIKSFACSSVSKDKDAPPYKIIILDEADTITNDAQTALRRSMEIYSDITRFCIICNYVTRIIDPITSRCAMYKFDKIENDSFINKLKCICVQENVSYQEDSIEFICNISEGDLRKGISLLQYCSIMSNNNITKEELLIVSDELDDKTISDFLYKDDITFKDIQTFIKNILHEGNSSDSIISSLIRNLQNNTKISEITKANIGLSISNADKKMSNGSSEYLNLLNIFCNLI